MIHLESIENRSILELVFKPLSPISVGMLNEGNLRKVVCYTKNENIIPYIPSESIKGIMRSIARIISRSINDPIANNCNKGRHEDEVKSEDCKLEDIFAEERLKELPADKKNNLILSLKCPICRLFGSNMLASKLIFRDMEVDANEIFTYTSNSIDRTSNIALQGNLFTVEYIKPLNLFLKIIVNNISSTEKYLFARLLEYISERGLQIGGLKSKGYGLIKLDKESSKVKVLEFKEPKDENTILQNVDMLLLKNGFQEYNIEEYIKKLEA